MKAVLGLALLCCFVVGSLGVACKPELQCRLFKECACDNKVVVKAQVLGYLYSYTPTGGNALQNVYFIWTIRTYKPPGNPNRKFFILIVPDKCDWNFKIGGRYFFFGHQHENYPYVMKMSQAKGYKKYVPNASRKQKAFLRQISKGPDEEEEACEKYRD